MIVTRLRAATAVGRSARCILLCCAVAAAGCNESKPSVTKPATTQPVVVAPQVGQTANSPVLPVTTSATSPSRQGPADFSPAPSSGTGKFSPELVQTVEDLIRVTSEYNQVAATIQDRQSYIKRSDELREIEDRLSPLVQEVEIATDRLSPADKAEFDRQYYDTRAKPVIDQKFAHTRRFEAFFR